MEQEKKVPSAAAGYMELTGASKDGGCRKVEVAGGVSRELGCCNLFHPEAKDTTRFSCGTCEYVIKSRVAADHPLQSTRKR